MISSGCWRVRPGASSIVGRTLEELAQAGGRIAILRLRAHPDLPSILVGLELEGLVTLSRTHVGLTLRGRRALGDRRHAAITRSDLGLALSELDHLHLRGWRADRERSFRVCARILGLALVVAGGYGLGVLVVRFLR